MPQLGVGERAGARNLPGPFGWGT